MGKIIKSVKEFLGIVDPKEREVFNNNLIAGKIFEALKVSCIRFSADPFLEVATYVLVRIHNKQFDDFRHVFDTASASGVFKFLTYYQTKELEKNFKDKTCCFEIQAFSDEDLPEAAAKLKKEMENDGCYDEKVIRNFIDVVGRPAMPEDAERKSKDIFKEGQSTITISTTVEESGKRKRSYNQLEDPIVDGNRVYFRLRIIDDQATNSESGGAALALLECNGSSPSFLNINDTEARTFTIKNADLNVGGPHSAPGSVGARIKSDHVKQLHFVIHHRDGHFYVEPHSDVAINGIKLITADRPWAEVKSDDTISIPGTNISMKFTTIQ